MTPPPWAALAAVLGLARPDGAGLAAAASAWAHPLAPAAASALRLWAATRPPAPTHPYGPALAAVLRLRGPDGRPLRRLPAAIDARASAVVEEARRAGAEPPHVLALCLLESGLRVRHRRASLCGCQPYNTGDRRQARCAAISWARAVAYCRSPERAVNRYVSGSCEPPRAPTRGAIEWVGHLARYRASWSRLAAALAAAAPGGAEVTPRSAGRGGSSAP